MLYHIFCLFGLFHPTQEFFLHMETSTLLTKGCKFWPIQSTHGHGAVHEGSLACHTYCDTWHPFIMVISEDPWHSHLLPSVWQWSCHYLFLQLRSVLAGIRTPNLPLAGQTLKTTMPPPWLLPHLEIKQTTNHANNVETQQKHVYL